MVVACIALAVALGGTSYAAIKPPRNSVGSSVSRGSATPGALFEGGSGDFVRTTNANLSNSETRGSGSAYYVRANGTGVTALYGWREDALGGASACRVFGQAIGG
jgi:hypothetical protein